MDMIQIRKEHFMPQSSHGSQYNKSLGCITSCGTCKYGKIWIPRITSQMCMGANSHSFSKTSRLRNWTG